MYVHDLGCSWIKHPFATSKFAVSSAEHISKIQQVGITELVIDTDRGLDVAKEPVAESIALAKVQPETKLRIPPETTVEGSDNRPVPAKTCLEDALERAVKVREEATEVVSSIMEDVRLGKQLEVEKIGPIVENMVESVMGNTDALLGLTRIREMDQYTFEHSVSVSVLLAAFAKHLGMPREDIVEVGIGGMLHDIGKTKTPLGILNKPAKLTSSEFEIMRKHVTYSEEILSLVPGLSEIALSIALEHHERFDGSGYPLKISGDDISLVGQMGAIVDVYDAITADRCYHKGMLPSTAMKKLNQWSGGHFNPELVQAFIHCVGIYPPGTLVSLSNGKVALILESSEGQLLLPKVRVIFDSLKRSFVAREDIDLSNQGERGLSIIGSVDPVKWRIDPMEYMDIPN